MMKLSLMYDVDCQISPNGENPIAETILAAWEYDPGSLHFVRSSANFVYRFRRQGQPFFLRFNEQTERTRAAIEAEMDVLQWVVGRGIAGITVTTPVLSSTGSSVETVTTEHGLFHAVVFPQLEGAQLEMEALDDMHYWRWGAALGKLHTALHTYTGSGLASRGSWSNPLDTVKISLSTRDARIATEYTHVVSALQELPQSPDSYGLIHFDFELDNIFWQDQAINICDFDECAQCWYVADIAFALRDLLDDPRNFNSTSFKAFIAGYAEQYPIDAALLGEISLFLRVAKLYTYAKLIRSLDLPESPKEQDWMRSLRQKLNAWIERYTLSLESSS